MVRVTALLHRALPTISLEQERPCTSGQLMYSPISCRNNVMRFLLSLLSLTLLIVGIARAETLSPKAFTEAAAAAARAAMPSAQVTVKGDLHLATRSAAGEEITTDLHNAYATYLRLPDHRDDIIRSYIGVLVESLTYGDAKTPLDRSLIVPVLKPLRWVDGARRVQKEAKIDPKPEILTDPFNSELAVVYVT